ncbi:MAG: class I SAM-dependent methyltransferase [Myxococcota bacterium]|nr:class I SAM-dependent methyltransferase [Myxococcota bacterium]
MQSQSSTAGGQQGLYDRPVLPAAGREHVGVSPCPVCAATGAWPRFEVQGLELQVVECKGCGLGRLDPLPSDADLDALYPAAYYGDLGSKFREPIESLVRAVGSRHLRFLVAGLRADARVLDVGCGRGLLLGALADRGFEAHGFEIHEAAVRGADPRATIRVARELPDAGFPSGWFDSAVLWHVLEHMRDPRAVVTDLHRILAPGGRLVVAVPNFASFQARWAGPAWFHLDLPRHLYQFPLRALTRLLAQGGFRIESVHHFSLRQNPFGWIQSRQNMRPDLPRNGLYTLLYRRTSGEPQPFDARTRRRMLAGLVLGALPALALSVAAALLRSGATVHVVATKV